MIALRSAIVLLGAGAFFAGLLTFQYFRPATIVLSYAEEKSCTPRLTAFPWALKPTESSPAYDVSYSGGLNVGELRLLATEVCVTPTERAQKTRQLVAVAPLGLGIISSIVIIEPGNDPNVKPVLSNKIAITKPLVVSLSSPDVLHTYHLHIADQITTCENGEKVSCPLDSLDIKQGKSYDYQLERKFIRSDSDVVAEGKLDIEDAVSIKSTSIKQGQVVYDKIRSFTIVTNKDIENAEATLTYTQQGSVTAIPLKIALEKSKIKLVAPENLPRNKGFVITLTAAEAIDGSTLLKPFAIKFSTSGGPTVTGSSLADTVYSAGTVSIYLDQPISQDSLSGRVLVNGVNTSASTSDKTISVTLPSLAQCEAVNIQILKGIVSKQNGLKSNSSWTASTRVACGTSKVIGHSVQGRPLVAYYFGTSGGTTTLFTGGIHGSEPSSTTTMDAWVDYLRLNAYRIPSGKQIVVIPNMNPDGIAIGNRLNARNVNLARNYPTSDWQKNIETVGGYLPGGGGTSAASEPETKAVIAAVSSLPIKLAISYHAQGSLVGSNNYSTADSYASHYASTLGYGNMSYNAEETMGYAITGEFETWLAESGVPAILIELPTTSGNYLYSHQDLIWQIATE